MSVQNKLTNSTESETGLVEYESNGQIVKLSPSMIRKFLVNGNGQVSDQEVMMFLSLCKYQKLNPFLKEAYLIKYGTQPATIVTGKDALMRRAMHNPAYKGHEAGVVVLMDNGLMENRVGTIVLAGEKLVGGWANVHVAGWETPMTLTVSFDEYVGRKSNGEINQQWSAKPGTMIRKVALVQAMREAFPDDLSGMYAPEEMQHADVMTDEPVLVDDYNADEAKNNAHAASEALFGE